MVKRLGWATLVLVVAAGGWWLVTRGGRQTAAEGGTAGTGLATVVRTTVTAREVVGGRLSYLDGQTIVGAGGGGVLTWLPAPGTVIGADQRLYEVDGRPVLLWLGGRPAWRDFGTGMTDGDDVRQLQHALHQPATGHFGAATATAVRHWQAAHGLAQTGRVRLGQVVFMPQPVRVAALAAAPGQPVAPGTELMSVTSTAKGVLVGLDPVLRGDVHPGAPVRITLPLDGGRLTAGTVQTVGEAAAGSNGQVTVQVTVALDDPAAAVGLDQVPVQVSITVAAHEHVLAVPVDALLAAPGGGYRVAVRDGAARRLVPVRTGLFDESGGLVEVTGVDEGARVEVPA